MNILLLGDDSVVEKFLKFFKNLEPQWSFVNYTSYEIASLDTPIDSFDYDFLIVDYTIESLKEIFDDIIKINPLIRTIILSDQLQASSPFGCDYCEENYKRKRIFKPVGFEELYKTLKEFDSSQCPYKSKFDSVKNIIPSLLKKYSYLNYNSETQTIYSLTHSTNNRYTYEFVSIINILETNKIPFVIEDEFQIKIV